MYPGLQVMLDLSACYCFLPLQLVGPSKIKSSQLFSRHLHKVNDANANARFALARSKYEQVRYCTISEPDPTSIAGNCCNSSISRVRYSFLLPLLLPAHNVPITRERPCRAHRIFVRGEGQSGTAEPWSPYSCNFNSIQFNLHQVDDGESTKPPVQLGPQPLQIPLRARPQRREILIAS